MRRVGVVSIYLCFLLALSACSGALFDRVGSDICLHFEGSAKQNYCRLSEEVSAMREALAQSVRDRVISVDRAVRLRNALNRADAVLDDVAELLRRGDDVMAAKTLTVARSILLEIKQHE